MKVAILSDTHDNWSYIKKVCKYFNKENISTFGIYDIDNNEVDIIDLADI